MRQFVSVTMIALLMLSVLFGIFYSIDTHNRLVKSREEEVISNNSTSTRRSLGGLFDPISDAFANGVIVDFGLRAAMYVLCFVVFLCFSGCFYKTYTHTDTV